jgi:hypothetical protein
MQEDEFEKQVQKKMDQLEFDPSDSVWAHVDIAVNGENKRRKPLFWLFFLAAPVVAVTGYFYFTNGHSENSSHFHHSVANDSKPAKQTPAEPVSNSGTGKAGLGGSGNIHKTGLNSNRKIQRNKGFFQSDTVHTKLFSVTATANDVAGEKTAEKKMETKTTPADSATLLIARSEQVKKTPAGDSTGLKALTKTKNNKTSSLQFGFTGIFGISEMNGGLFQQPYSNSYYAPINGSSGTGGSVSASKVYSGFSFSLGGFISKRISDRMDVSGGLNYHYYSTKVNIEKVTSYPAFNTNSNPLVLYTPAGYNTGNGSRSYTNQYHFIELPVLADFRLNKNKQTPVLWEAGFSFAWLLSTNALYFDPASNLYYQNAGQFSKTQWNISSAVLVGLSINKSQLLFGPQVQYALSEPLKNSTNSPQHLLSYGMKISFIPNKK